MEFRGTSGKHAQETTWNEPHERDLARTETVQPVLLPTFSACDASAAWHSSNAATYSLAKTNKNSNRFFPFQSAR
jgi:hypothetical protein